MWMYRLRSGLFCASFPETPPAEAGRLMDKFRPLSRAEASRPASPSDQPPCPAPAPVLPQVSST